MTQVERSFHNVNTCLRHGSQYRGDNCPYCRPEHLIATFDEEHTRDGHQLADTDRHPVVPDAVHA